MFSDKTDDEFPILGSTSINSRAVSKKIPKKSPSTGHKNGNSWSPSSQSEQAHKEARDTNTSEATMSSPPVEVGNAALRDLKEQLEQLKEENKKHLEKMASQLEHKLDTLIDHRLKEISTTVGDTIAEKLTRKMQRILSNQKVASQNSGMETSLSPLDPTAQPPRESAPVSQLDELPTPENPSPNRTKDMLAELDKIERQTKTHTTIQDPTHDTSFPGSSKIT